MFRLVFSYKTCEYAICYKLSYLYTNATCMQERLMSRKKPTYPVGNTLKEYLVKYNRDTKIPVFYDDLLRFSGGISVYDKNDNDTLWISVYYPDHERESIYTSLKRVYAILHSDGNENILPFVEEIIEFMTSPDLFF